MWENVPGALSSVTYGHQRDINFLLDEFRKRGPYVCEWRVLDTQYVRVERFARAIPQRRRRVFIVVVLNCYRTFEERVEDVLHTAVSKPDRIRNMIDRTLGRFKKSDLIEKCPDISETTIERTLKQFLDEGYILKLGGGRGTAYAKK